MLRSLFSLCLYIFVVLFLSYTVITGKKQSLNYSSDALRRLVYCQQTVSVTEKVSRAYLFSGSFSSGNSSFRIDLSKMESEVDGYFLGLEEDKTVGFTKEVSDKIVTAKSQWIELKKQLKSAEKTDFLPFANFIETLKSLSLTIVNTSEFGRNSTMAFFPFVENVLVYMPEIYKDIPQICLLSDAMMVKKKGDAAQILLLQKQSEAIEITRKFLSENISVFVREAFLISNFQASNQILTDFIKYINGNLISHPKLPESVSALLALAQEVFNKTAISANSLFESTQNGLTLEVARASRDLNIAFISLFTLLLLPLIIRLFLALKSNRVLIALKNLASGGEFNPLMVSGQGLFSSINLAVNELVESVQDIRAKNVKATAKIEELHHVSSQLYEAQVEMAAAKEEQESTLANLTAQEATTKEIAATAKEISGSSKELASFVSRINVAGEETSQLANAGKEGMEKMTTIMQQMVNASNDIASKLSVLNEKANNITGVITTITKVADQTNLLSLNAAIEAEKAGEHGRSFTVIAREIRRLADQTAYSTLDIEKMINEMRVAVTSGVMGVDKFSDEIRTGVNQVNQMIEQLANIIAQVQKQSEGIESVNKGMQSQAQAAEQIDESIHLLSDVTYQTGDSMRKYKQVIEKFQTSIKSLFAMIDNITL